MRRYGRDDSAVVVIDDFTGSADRIVELAAAMRPFPTERTTYYPGVRRTIDEADRDAFAYVQRSCRDAAPFIAGAFGFHRFALIDASFSIVTAPPETLVQPQRGPHFDSTDPGYLALLHYLNIPEPSGTAFYRQRSTGIEQVSDRNVDRFVETSRREMAALPADSGYIQGTTDLFEQIGAVEAVPDRMVIYQGSLLHSGIIPPAMPLSHDPRVGRLTANFFIIRS
jgi:hypothetical protein